MGKMKELELEKQQAQAGRKQCPRCKLNWMPVTDAGHGVSLSRRGKVLICSDCGTEEVLLDSGHLKYIGVSVLRERRVMKIAGHGYRRPRWMP